MSGSFSSRRMTGNGSGASQGLRSEKGAHDDNLCSSIDLVSDSVSKRVLQLVKSGGANFKLCAQRFNGRGGTPPEPAKCEINQTRI